MCNFDRKLRNVLIARILKFLHERSTKQPEDYNEFYKAYGLFLKEGIITSNDQSEKVLIKCISHIDVYKIYRLINFCSIGRYRQTSAI